MWLAADSGVLFWFSPLTPWLMLQRHCPGPQFIDQWYVGVGRLQNI